MTVAGTSGRPSTPPPVPPPPASPPPAERPSPTASDLERAIASVAGVVTAQVSRSPEGRDRLRISLAPGADAESAAWAVAATLRERFGIALDPAAITARMSPEPSDVAEGAAMPPSPAPVPPGPEDTSGGPAARTTRPTQAPRARRRYRAAIYDLLAHAVGDDLDVTATLLLDDRQGRGTARGLRTRRGRWRAICEATLSALAELTAGQVRATVDHVTVLSFPDLAHVTVSVTLLTEQGEETFLGAALVRDDADRAVMRATLDAVNRRVEPWLVGSA